MVSVGEGSLVTLVTVVALPPAPAPPQHLHFTLIEKDLSKWSRPAVTFISSASAFRILRSQQLLCFKEQPHRLQSSSASLFPSQRPQLQHPVQRCWTTGARRRTRTSSPLGRDVVSAWGLPSLLLVLVPNSSTQKTMKKEKGKPHL